MTTTTPDALPHLAGRTIVVTGASAGIGAAASRRFAAAGATVVPVGRDPGKTAAVAGELGVEPLVADFADLSQVRRLADALLARCERIDVLANNAGGLFRTRTRTLDGHERTFQVNHLAPFLLTALLRERIEATAGARVIQTSSAGNQLGKVDLDDLDSTAGRWSAWRAYGTTKLMNILFTRELASRLGGTATASAFHPGIVATEFGRDSPSAGLFYRTPLRRLATVPPETGALPLLRLATQPDPESVDGAYVDRNGPARTSAQARDPELARALWERSAQMVGVPA